MRWITVVGFLLHIAGLQTQTEAPGVCSSFSTKRGYNRKQGVPIVVNVTLFACKLFCERSPSCAAVDWNINDGSCWVHTTPGSPTKDPCCVHAAKNCDVTSTSLTPPIITTTRRSTISPTMKTMTSQLPTTTPHPTTTHPTLLATTTIPDRGCCDGRDSATLKRIDGISQMNGAVAAGTRDVEACKLFCLLQSTCTAADYNNATSTCQYHVTRGQLVNVSTSIHFKKIDCARLNQLRCYVQEETRESILTFTRVILRDTALNVTLQDCSGGRCVHTEQLNLTDLTITTSRGCDFRPRRDDRSDFGKYLDPGVRAGNPGPRIYGCRFDRCNGLGIRLVAACTAYHPMDGDANDLSPFHRQGKAVDIAFSPVEKRLKYSAMFNGISSYIELPDLLFSYGVINTLSDVLPRLSISFWYKRTDGTGTSVLFTNGRVHMAGSPTPPYAATVQIIATPNNGGRDVEARLVLTDGSALTANMTSRLNEWVMLTLLLRQNTVSQTIIMELRADDANSTFASDMDSSSYPNRDAVPYPPTPPSGVFLGRNTVEPYHYFKGFIDEFWIISEILAETEIQGLRDRAS